MTHTANIQSWLDAGYKRWETHAREIYKLADYGLQKRITDPESGLTRYFITCYVYEWDRFKDRDPNMAGRVAIMPTAQLSETEGRPTTDVELHTYDVTVAESTIHTLWEALGRPMYEE
jgi:hypothetical protein